MQALYLYTEEFFLAGRVKNGIKKLLGKHNRGPGSVAKSLLQGLQLSHTDYCLNQDLSGPARIAAILSGTPVLNWAINAKRQGKIKKLIAGPNIIVVPQDQGGIITNALIDLVVVPSLWVKDFYIKSSPSLSGRVAIWAAGVEVADEVSVKTEYDFIIYNKIGKQKLYSDIVDFLNEHKCIFKVMTYGHFDQADYFKELEKTRYLIYLSESESQGLAMFEAWARNVPTLVWERGWFEKEGVKITGNTASPYLTEQAGLRFKDLNEFKQLTSQLKGRVFRPREYVEQNFTNQIAAQRFCEIAYA